jgi:hypothetical protein
VSTHRRVNVFALFARFAAISLVAFSSV